MALATIKRGRRFRPENTLSELGQGPKVSLGVNLVCTYLR